MHEPKLRDRRLLIVEDEFLLAEELRAELEDAAAIVLGPAGTLEEALGLIESEPRIDGAILDVNLGGQQAFPAADLLAERGVPFVFTTGYDASILPSRFADVIRCEKPVNIARITRAMARLIED